MARRADVFAVLAWGLRSYAWVVVAFTVGLGVVVPFVLSQAPQTYEASAQAGPSGRVRLPNLDALPKVAASVFSNVYNAEEVRSVAGVDEGDALPPGAIELVAAQDNVVFTVVGRGETADEAKALADAATAVFVRELGKYTIAIGPYSVSTLAETPQEPMAQVGGITSWALGILAGLLAGVGVVALICMIRRPVIDTVSTEEAVGAPVFARLALHRGRAAPTGMAPLCRRILAEPTDLLLLVGPQRTRQDRTDLTEELVRWLGRVRRVVPLGRRAGGEAFGSVSLTAHGSGAGADESSELLVIEDASPVEVATRPDRSLILLVVREGLPERRLRDYAEQYLDGDDTAIVLVSRQLRRWHNRDAPTRAARRSSHKDAPAGEKVDRAVSPAGAEDTATTNERG